MVELLNENLLLPKDEQIELSEFELDIQREERKAKAAEIERTEVKKQYEQIIQDCNKMSEMIIQNCWNKMKQKSRFIKVNL